MEKLIQLLLNQAVEKRVFGSFSEFKSVEGKETEINEAKVREGLEKSPVYKAVMESGVDTAKLREMLETSFDAAQAKLKQNAFKAFDIIFDKK